MEYMVAEVTCDERYERQELNSPEKAYMDDVVIIPVISTCGLIHFGYFGYFGYFG
jgi:hypothetical protein